MMAAGTEMQTAFMESLIGKPQKVLIEEIIEIDGEKYSAGFTPEYVRMAIKGDENQVNSIAALVPSGIKNLENTLFLI